MPWIAGSTGTAPFCTNRGRGAQGRLALGRELLTGGQPRVVYAGLWANGDTWAQVDDVSVTP
jgi:hypothetical protein